MRTKLLSAAEQVAERLRDELFRGRWSGTLPGIHRLSSELGFPRKPVERALLLLEKQGLLVPQGVGRRRQIMLPENRAVRPMRVAILDHDPTGIQESFMANLINCLTDQGHAAFFADKTLVELGMDVRRVSRLVRKTEADIWIVVAGSREVLQWFVEQKIPSFAVFGHFPNLPIAGMGLRYLAPMLAATQKLLELGHCRIVYLACRGRLGDEPGSLWHRLLEEIEMHGITTGSYNLPGWDDSPEGFHALLKSLFASTPPTALVIEEIPHTVAALQFCA